MNVYSISSSQQCFSRCTHIFFIRNQGKVIVVKLLNFFIDSGTKGFLAVSLLERCHRRKLP